MSSVNRAADGRRAGNVSPPAPDTAEAMRDARSEDAALAAAQL